MSEARRPAPGAIRLVVESRLENVAPAGRAVAAIAVYAGMMDVEAAQVELCVVEAANNAIRHACGLRPDREVEVAFAMGGGWLEIAITDDGAPMPDGLLLKPFEFDPTDIESLPEGGMGLYIIRCVMDELKSESAGGRNRLIMRKAVPVTRPD